MKVLIEPEAEIEAAAAWYQLEAPGMGNEFLRAVQAAIAALGRQPCGFRHCLRANSPHWLAALPVEFVL